MDYNKNSNKILFLFSILIILAAGSHIVLGATNMLDSILKPFSGIDIASTYQKYYAFIDAVLYFILFIGIASSGLDKVFPNNKSVPIIIGVILAIAMSVFEKTAKFNLMMLGPFAALVFFVTIGVWAYNWAKNIGGTGFAAFALAFGVTTTLIEWLAPSLVDWIESVELLGTIWSIAKVIGYIALIFALIVLIRGAFSGGNIFRKGERNEKSIEKEQRKLLEKEDKATKKVANVASEMQKLEDKIKQLESIEEKFVDEKGRRKELSKEEQLQITDELVKTIQGTWQIQKAIQQLNKNIGKPGYNQELENKINEYKSTLQKYASKLEELIKSLKDTMSSSRNQITQNLMDLESELRKDIEIIVKDSFLEEEETEKELNNKLKSSVLYPQLSQEFGQLKQKTRNSISEDAIVKDSDNTIKNQLQYAKEYYTDILNRINKVIDLLNNDPSRKRALTTVISKTLQAEYISDQTLQNIYREVLGIKSKIEGILQIESSNFEMMKRRKERIMNLLKTWEELINAYPTFTQRIHDKTLELYSEEDKLFEKYAIKMIEIAQKLIITDPSIGILQKKQDIEVVKKEISSMLYEVQETIPEGKLKEDIKEHAKAIFKFTDNFLSESTKKRPDNQKLIHKFILALTNDIQKRREIILQNAKKK